MTHPVTMSRLQGLGLKKHLFLPLLLGIVLAALVAGPALGADTGYKLGAEDVLAVAIFAGGVVQTPEDLEIEIDSKGVVNLPFLGPVKAAGMTVSALIEMLVKKLAKDYFVDPQVTIRVTSTRAEEFTSPARSATRGSIPLSRG